MTDTTIYKFLTITMSSNQNNYSQDYAYQQDYGRQGYGKSYVSKELGITADAYHNQKLLHQDSSRATVHRCKTVRRMISRVHTEHHLHRYACPKSVDDH
jgi:hypothetical protein